MKRAFLLFFFCVVNLSLFGQQYENMVVEKIEITINTPKVLDSEIKAVKAQLQTKEKERFSHSEFDQDLKQLAAEYDRVETSYKIVDQKLHILLSLWLKPHIHAIYFKGNENISSKKLNKELDIDPQTIFEREEFIKAFNKLKALYVKKGYFQAQLDYAIIPIENSSEINIEISVNEGLSGKIKKIEFRGVTSTEEDEIYAAMVTKKYNYFLGLISNYGCYHPEMIEHDKMTLVNYLQDKGYADASVQIEVEPADKKNRIILIITIDKGACYRVGKIHVEGNTLFSTELILEQLTFGSNWVYSPEGLRSSVKAVTDLYGSRGYIDTAVDMSLTLREDYPVYDISIIINEEEQYCVGLVKVFGNLHTHNRVVLHESLMCPGELFDNRRLEATEHRLLNTGLFENVNVYAVQSQLEDPCATNTYRDVFIEVEETDTGNIGLFGGFSSLDRMFGGVELTERNFNIAGLTKIFQNGPGALRGGGEFAHIKLNLGDRQTAYTFQWTKPYFMDTPWIVGVDLEKANNRALSKAYEVNTYGGNVHGIYIWNNYLKSDIHYRAIHTNLDFRGNPPPKDAKIPDGTGLISAVGAAFVYDSTDRPRCPTLGLRSRLSYELAGVGGNFQFMKWSYHNTYYYPFSMRGTFKFRGDIDFIHTWGSTDPIDVPMSERLFLGGETTVRAYRNYVIGPQEAQNQPIGGLSAFLLSEEYQHNLLLNPRLDLFCFVDAGYVTDKEFTIGRYAASAGLGIRVEVMRNMPIMLGYGWPMHPIGKDREGRPVDNAQRFFFAAGGNF